MYIFGGTASVANSNAVETFNGTYMERLRKDSGSILKCRYANTYVGCATAIDDVNIVSIGGIHNAIKMDDVDMLNTVNR